MGQTPAIYLRMHRRQSAPSVGTFGHIGKYKETLVNMPRFAQNTTVGRCSINSAYSFRGFEPQYSTEDTWLLMVSPVSILA